jgi:hypothetical protein
MFALEMRECNGVDIICKCMQKFHSKLEIQTEACKLLSELAKDSWCCDEMGDKGAVQVLVTVIRNARKGCRVGGILTPRDGSQSEHSVKSLSMQELAQPALDCLDGLAAKELNIRRMKAAGLKYVLQELKHYSPAMPTLGSKNLTIPYKLRTINWVRVPAE